MSNLVTVAAFFVLLGGLVFVHELGHFLAAKFFNVKVLKFSLGFGPRIWGYRRGETEYQLAALPLGGFVKMAGENPTEDVSPEDQARSFSAQKPYRRAIIALAGPFVNLTLPVAVYFMMNLAPQMKEPPIVGAVIPNEPAELAGVQSGDRIVSVDGVPTESFEAMREAIEARPGKDIEVVVNRQGEQKSLRVKTSSEVDKNILETTHKGKIGVMIGKIPSYVGVVPGSRADQAGLKTFDRVVSVNGQAVVSRGEMLTAVKKAGTNPVSLQVVRNEPIDLKTTSVSSAETLSLTIPGGSDPIGIDIPDLYVREVPSDSKAFAAGMRPGDKIVAIDGTPVVSGMRLEAILSDKKEAMLADKKSVNFTIERAGSKQDLTYEAVTYVKKDKLMGSVPTVELGFRPHPRIYSAEPFKPDELVPVQYSVVKAFSRATEQTLAVTRQMAMGIGAMINGRVSSEHLGGIIMLYQLTGVATENGLASFLQLFALISINLGLMNLLPIPALDGFHILMSSIEGISRRAVPVRVREIAQVVGIVMILSLMALAFKNDIMRIVRADSETSMLNHR